MDKYNFTTKLRLACIDNELRPIINCVHFIEGFAYASNGHIIIKQSMEYHSIIDKDHLNGHSLHRLNYANIMQFEFATANEEGVACQNKDGRTAFFEYFDPKGEIVPNFERVISQFSAKGVDFIGISPKQIEILGKAFYNGDQVRIQFAGIDKGMIIDVLGYEDQIAYLMPIILNGTLF